MDAAARARAYYRALDEGDYDALASLLAPEFVQERPDRTFEGRERFVEFMRDERPQTDTTHAVDAVYVANEDGSAPRHDGGPPDHRGAHAEDHASADVAVRGRLLDAEGDRVVGFVDVFALGEDGFDRLDTYTR